MQTYLFVALGGALGALSRYGAGRLVACYLPGLSFPVATFGVNIIGSFLLGVCFVLINEKYPSALAYSPLITVGFLGALTTFSTFMVEVINLLSTGKITLALVYLTISVILGLFAAWLGIIITRLI